MYFNERNPQRILPRILISAIVPSILRPFVYSRGVMTDRILPEIPTGSQFSWSLPSQISLLLINGTSLGSLRKFELKEPFPNGCNIKWNTKVSYTLYHSQVTEF